MIKMKNCQHRYDSMWPLSHLFRPTINFFILASILTASFGQASIYDSNNSVSNYGGIFPAGHIILPINQTLQLFCSINIEKAKADNYTIEDLIFLKEAAIIDRSYIKRVNETTIQVILGNLIQSTDMYYCMPAAEYEYKPRV